jgi:pteridine reductase
MIENSQRVALVTGGARRIGAAIVTRLHAAGYRVIVHHNRSVAAAQALAEGLNTTRLDTAAAMAADLQDPAALSQLATDAVACWGRMDLLVNNASVFEPSPLGNTSSELWDALMDSNLKAPFRLAEALAPALRIEGGAVVNISDIHADQPLAGHAVYSAAKAGLVMLTRSLARDLAPDVQVNAVAPGAILWPERQSEDEAQDADPSAETRQAAHLTRVPMGRMGTPLDVAEAVLFLSGARYLTGQVLRVDGGRHMT